MAKGTQGHHKWYKIADGGHKGYVMEHMRGNCGYKGFIRKSQGISKKISIWASPFVTALCIGAIPSAHSNAYETGTDFYIAGTNSNRFLVSNRDTLQHPLKGNGQHLHETEKFNTFRPPTLLLPRGKELCIPITILRISFPNNGAVNLTVFRKKHGCVFQDLL
ncbi:hypothetical protein CEXT_202661 [Caerostris extrusa]|uniref:Uncharacterized protein n=1 Tax=Caerostris extrusa TaxID=172846 RepID=A0AAV4RV68_CAEEX|nr:hypothetical protein CEXT_202661 [Caerostris extrusa]